MKFTNVIGQSFNSDEWDVKQQGGYTWIECVHCGISVYTDTTDSLFRLLVEAVKHTPCKKAEKKPA